MVVVAIIGILAAIAIPLYQNLQANAQLAKVQADIRTIEIAIVVYSVHCGNYPGQAGDTCNPGGAAPDALLVVQINPEGQTTGPFFEKFPTPPAGWGPAYVINIPGPEGPGTFEVVAGPPINGDNDREPVTSTTKGKAKGKRGSRAP